MTIDYKPIQIAYVLGKRNNEGKTEYPTLADLAAEYGVSLSALTHKAAQDGWARQRKQSEDRIVLDAFRRYESEMAELLADIDKKAARASAIMLDTVVQALEDAESPHERQVLTVKYSKLLPDILNAGHTAIGVERVIERANQKVEDMLLEQ